MSGQQTLAQNLDPNSAVRSFFADPEWGVKTAIGATFNAISILILTFNPMFLPVSVLLWSLVCGYMLKVMRGDVNSKSRKLPEWRDWMDMAISGLTWFAVLFGFVLLIFSVFTVSMMVGAARGCIYAPDPRFIPWAVSTFVMLFVLSLFVSLTTTFLQVNLAQEERMPAAFALRKVTQRFRKKGFEMLEAWLLAIALNTLAVAIPFCTVIGACLIPATSFIANAISATILAQAWNEE